MSRTCQRNAIIDIAVTWGPNLPSEDESFAVMKAAVDAGATVFSTATFYGNSPDDLFANVKLIKRFFDKVWLAPF